MTLSTHIYLLTEADPADVFMKCRDLLGATDAHTWKDEPSFYSEKDGDDERVISNDCGQGLPAWLLIRYRPGAMVRASHAEHDPDICDEDCDGRWHKPAHWVDVDFDTAYSYSDSYGGCGALHARLIFDLGGWFDEQGIQWAWQNEFTGDIHMGDKYERLYDLVKAARARCGGSRAPSSRSSLRWGHVLSSHLTRQYRARTDDRPESWWEHPEQEGLWETDLSLVKEELEIHRAIGATNPRLEWRDGD